MLEKIKPDEDGDMLSTEAKDWQWWYFEYVSNDSNPVVVKVRFLAATAQAKSVFCITSGFLLTVLGGFVESKRRPRLEGRKYGIPQRSFNLCQ